MKTKRVNNPLSRAFALAKAQWQTRLPLMRVHRATRLVQGPRHIPGGSRDWIVLCLTRDGVRELPHFLRHYRSLGARHFVFLDNASVDGTSEYLAQQKDVTVYSSHLSYGKHQHAFRRFLFSRHAWHRWVLFADIDECFDFPGSDRISMDQFLAYLDERDFDAVMTHLLDMFSDEPVLRVTDAADGNLAKTFRHFDLSEIVREPYEGWFGDTNVRGNPAAKIYWGGIRRKVFGLCDPLTKHPLVKLRGRMKALRDAHNVFNARVADVTTVFYHYKFTASFSNVLRLALSPDNHAVRTRNYSTMLRVLEANPELRLKLDTAHELRDTRQLLELGFLETSSSYEAWVEQAARR